MSRKGVSVAKMFCTGDDPYSMFTWTKRRAELKDGGKVLFFQDNVEAPDFWSDNACFVLADKYFRAAQGTAPKESSLKQVADRVADAIVKSGIEQGYLDKVTAPVFANELKVMLVSQRFSFNSPVYFNVGCGDKPQGAACFILIVHDSLESISGIVPVIVQLFAKGSGCGFNLSYLRESGAPLSRGGVASGPTSFLLGYNAFAGIIKSGGVQRRAAMLARLDDWHPDVLEFIEMKSREERKVRALIKKGYTADEASATVAFQNVNLSIGVSDALMKAAKEGKDWALKSVLDRGKVVKTIKANDIIDMIAHGSHFCGDPGIQFDDAMNRANPLIKMSRILSTNPCVEFCCIPNTACNLASLNLASFYKDGRFQHEEFRHAVRISIIAQDILVGMCGYPTPEITKNSNDYRPLGLGFTNLGGLFIKMGIPYDSDQARMMASSITAEMTAAAYQTSIDVAKVVGPFAGFEANRKGMLSVLKAHKNKLNALEDSHSAVQQDFDGISDAWEQVCQGAAKHGVRNCQVTLVAPAGTISNILDCTTSGIEPLLFTVTKRRLDQGGEMLLPSFEMMRGMSYLGYSKDEQAVVMEYIKSNGTIDGSPVIKPNHVPIFDPVYPLKVGDRCVSALAQIRMMAAVQPFISGAISKTIGLPETTTPEMVKEIIFLAWESGLKAISFYRNNSKPNQPLVNALQEEKGDEDGPVRKKMPEEVKAHIHRGVIAPGTLSETKIYIIPGELEGMLAEVFATLAKEGSALRGLVDALMTAVSIGLQYGVPLEVFCKKFIGTKFEPMGWTRNKKIKFTTSLVDYIFKYLGSRYLGMDFSTAEASGEEPKVEPVKDDKTLRKEVIKALRQPTQYNTYDLCECGGMLHMEGACKRCSNPLCKRNRQGGGCGGG